jgi:hypothetical protein
VEEEDPEHPASVRVHKASKKNALIFRRETSKVIPIVEKTRKPSSAAVPAAVVAASRPHLRGQDAPATAGKLPALQKKVAKAIISGLSSKVNY